MMKLPTCCGNRMSLDHNTDETFCGTCGLRLSGQEMVKLELERQRKREDEIVITPPRMYPITIKSDPTDEIIIATASGPVALKPDPSVPAGTIRMDFRRGYIGPLTSEMLKLNAKKAAARLLERNAVDPLDVVIDRGWTLRDLIEAEQNERREQSGLVMAGGWRQCATQAQREAVSAYWSAQLRAKVAMSIKQDADRDRLQVVMEHDEL